MEKYLLNRGQNFLANIVFACASTKRFPATLYSRYFNQEDWNHAIKNKGPRYKVSALYKGPYWKEVMQVYEKYKKEHNFYVLSAGLGLISFEADAPSYNASFSKRSEDTVDIGWVPLPKMEGIISTSNEYLEAASVIGLTQLQPTGRRWLHYLGGTGFTIAPRLMDLYLQGKDLKKIYNGLPEPKKQIMPIGREKATEDIINRYYIPGIKATTLRKLVNDAGYSLSVQRTYDIIKTKRK